MTIYSKVISCQSSRSKKYSRPFGFEATFFASLFSESLLSERPGFDPRPGQTLRAHNFEALGPAGSKTNFFESPIIPLLVFKSLWSQQHFKDNLCPLEQPLLYFIKRQKTSFFARHCISIFALVQKISIRVPFSLVSMVNQYSVLCSFVFFL